VPLRARSVYVSVSARFSPTKCLSQRPRVHTQSRRGRAADPPSLVALLPVRACFVSGSSSSSEGGSCASSYSLLSSVSYCSSDSASSHSTCSSSSAPHETGRCRRQATETGSEAPGLTGLHHRARLQLQPQAALQPETSPMTSARPLVLCPSEFRGEEAVALLV